MGVGGGRGEGEETLVRIWFSSRKERGSDNRPTQLAKILGMKFLLSHWWRGLSLGLPKGKLGPLSWLQAMWGKSEQEGALVTSVLEAWPRQSLEI